MAIPRKLRPGDDVRILAPSCTLGSSPWMTEKLFEKAKDWFRSRGMTVSEAKHLHELDASDSASIAHRIADLHDAFRDDRVAAIITIRGGWNCNQLLPFIDYELIRKHPKILCGFSDITILNNAIYAKTGLVTYSGPNFAQFCLGDKIEYTYRNFTRAVMENGPVRLESSKQWTHEYFSPGKPWRFRRNEGWWTVRKGRAEGTCIGGNLCTLSLLQGTEFMPQPKGDIVLLVEDDNETHPRTFDRDLTSLTQQPWFKRVKGVLIGRFQPFAVNKGFGPVTRQRLLQTIAANKRLSKLPMLANVDFGHTNPMITFPIGGRVMMDAAKKQIVITRH